LREGLDLVVPRVASFPCGLCPVDRNSCGAILSANIERTTYVD
jgi:hypothetical protein